MKKIARAIISMGVVFAFAACSWEVPQNVSVKTNADYNFSLGTFEKELDNNMDLNSMMGDTGEGNQNIHTYDYFPGKLDKNTQHFMLEVQLLDEEILTQAAAQALCGANDSYSGTVALGTFNTDHVVGLDFNPATILSGMKEALGEDVADKIQYARVPLYLYCDTIEGLKAKAELKMFYGTKPLPASPSVPSTATNLIDPDKEITKTPKPNYTMEENVVVTDLETTSYAEKTEITNLVNATNASEDSQLCISWKITDLTATNIQKAAIGAEGIRIKLYAVIDLPLSFNVVEDLSLDLDELTKDMSGDSSSSDLAANEGSSASDEFKKYIKVIDSVTIKYIAFKLPFYSTQGMMLGIDMVGNGNYERAKIKIVDENKKITENDKSSIVLKQATIQSMKDISSFAPKIQIFMEEDTLFSIPREKAVKMNIEMNLKTDGTVQIQ